jgi:hypothetical protein
MVAWFTGLNPVLQALIATLFTLRASTEKYWTACSVLQREL